MIWVKDYRTIGGNIEGGADVWFTDGKYEIRCFEYPFDPEANYTGIIGFDGSDIVRSDAKTEIFKRLDNGEYFVVGKVVNRAKGLVQLGSFTFDCDEWIPSDIEENEFVEFIASVIYMIE